VTEEEVSAKLDRIENLALGTVETARKVQARLNISIIGRVLVSAVILTALIQIGNTQDQAIRNQELLIECTTPGTNPTPKASNDTGNPCWDRLHDPNASAGAIADIRKSIDCVALYFHTNEAPLPCKDVVGRVEAIRRGNG
jgi:hypothetical protein